MANTTGQETEVMARLAGVFFALIGLALLVASALVARSTLHFTRTAARAPGVVTALNAGGSHPEIQFRAGGGQVVSYPQGGMIADYRVGDRVTVLYDPHRPTSTACINVPGALWDGAGGLCLLGTVFLAVGLLRALGSNAVYVRGLEGRVE
jgi:hypothetical protein